MIQQNQGVNLVSIQIQIQFLQFVRTSTVHQAIQVLERTREPVCQLPSVTFYGYQNRQSPADPDPEISPVFLDITMYNCTI